MFFEQITWIDGLGNVVTDGISYTTKLLQDNYRFRTISQLRIATKRAYHQTTFKCQAQNTAERTHQTATIFINVSIRSPFKNVVRHSVFGTSYYILWYSSI